MRLIDWDKVLEWIHRQKETTEQWSMRIAIENYVDEMPTIDAEPVVRCKDCKWWSEDDNDSYGYCMAMKHGYMSANWEIGIYRKYKGDFYCADGERIEDEVE